MPKGNPEGYVAPGAMDMSSFMSKPMRSPAGSGMMGGVAPLPVSANPSLQRGPDMSRYMTAGPGVTTEEAAAWHKAGLPTQYTPEPEPESTPSGPPIYETVKEILDARRQGTYEGSPMPPGLALFFQNRDRDRK